MPSAHDSFFSDHGSPVLLQQFGESVTHYPLAVTASAVSRTAIVDRTAFGADPQISDNGEQIVYAATVTLVDSVSLDDRDTWSIDAVLWSTLGQVSKSGGLQTWHIQRAVQRSARSSTPRGS